jgi:hypothetical protein
VGEPVELTAKTVSVAYAPQPDVPVVWQIRPLSADTTQATAEPLARGRWKTDALGRAREVIEELPVGAYEAIAHREDGSEDPAPSETTTGSPEVRRVFIVEPPGRELARVDADPGTQRLQSIAEATEGEALIAHDDDALPRNLPTADPFAEGPGLRVDARREIPLWSGWLMWVLLAVGFGGEWIVRRRAGEP